MPRLASVLLVLLWREASVLANPVPPGDLGVDACRPESTGVLIPATAINLFFIFLLLVIPRRQPGAPAVFIFYSHDAYAKIVFQPLYQLCCQIPRTVLHDVNEIGSQLLIIG